MSVLNALLRPLFDGLLYPFRTLPPLVGLTVVSALVALFALWVYRRTSNQAAITAVKDRIMASLFEIRLFNDDIRAMFRAQADLMRSNLTYLRLNLVPLFWMIVPIVLLMGQLEYHYHFRGLLPGESTVLTVELRQDVPTDFRPAVSLVAPEGVRVETPAVWVPSRREMSWRVAAEREGHYDLEVRANDVVVGKLFVASERIERTSPRRPSRAFFDQLLYPAEAPVPKDGPVEAIVVGYPKSDTLHWMVPFFVLSLIIAFLLRKRFGVTF